MSNSRTTQKQEETKQDVEHRNNSNGYIRIFETSGPAELEKRASAFFTRATDQAHSAIHSDLRKKDKNCASRIFGLQHQALDSVEYESWDADYMQNYKQFSSSPFFKQCIKPSNTTVDPACEEVIKNLYTQCMKKS